MARAKSKSGRKSGGRKKKSSSKRGRSAASRARVGTSRKSARKTGRRKTGGARKTTRGRKTARKSTARKSGGRKTSRRAAGARARTTRTVARKQSRSSGQRGRKSLSSPTSSSLNLGGDDEDSGNERGGGQVEGEGSYTASRHFRTAQTDFVRRNRGNIARMGNEAETALEGREGDELRAAEEQARSHSAGDDE
jgi:hypothetical protein